MTTDKSVCLPLVLAGAFALPLVFVRDAFDRFRLPKELFLRGEAILLISVSLAALLLGARFPRFNWRDRSIALPLAAFGVMVVLTIASTKPALSAHALVAAASTLAVYFATIAAARNRASIVAIVPLVAAVLNALLVIIEELNLWMPFGEQAGTLHHLQCTAFVGNPNEVGAYLGAAALACLAMISWRTVPALLILATGLLASRTLTAMIAFAVAALALFAISSLKNAIRFAAAGAVLAIVLVISVAPLRTRATNMIQWLRHGDYNTLLTERLTPFVAAAEMFADHPITGAGPGTFAWHYYDYKIAAEVRHPSLRRAYNRGVNYGEVHNDHLQVLAEGGILGGVTFIALLVALASLSFSSANPFVRRMALPLALYWFVLSLAQFPLESTVVRILLVHFAALCVAWRDA
jgi:O-antigen ligase